MHPLSTPEFADELEGRLRNFIRALHRRARGLHTVIPFDGMTEHYALAQRLVTRDWALTTEGLRVALALRAEEARKALRAQGYVL